MVQVWDTDAPPKHTHTHINTEAAVQQEVMVQVWDTHTCTQRQDSVPIDGRVVAVAISKATHSPHSPFPLLSTHIYTHTVPIGGRVVAAVQQEVRVQVQKTHKHTPPKNTYRERERAR